jgi:TusA-related sulfurtransferase
MATTLDLKGLICPLPVLRTNKILKSMKIGEEVTVLVTDPAAPKDFSNYCETTGHRMLSSTEADGVITILIRKSA